MSKYHFTAVFEPQEEGGFTAIVPSLPGCISEGDTYEEARINITEAIHSYLGSLIRDGESLPSSFAKQHEEVIAPINVVFDPEELNPPPRSTAAHV